MGNIDPEKDQSVRVLPETLDRVRLQSLPADRVVPGLYRHWKGGQYVVIGCAEMDGTRLPVVIYRPIAVGSVLTVRPLEDFRARVNVQGVAIPRFVLESPFLDGG